MKPLRWRRYIKWMADCCLRETIPCILQQDCCFGGAGLPWGYSVITTSANRNAKNTNIQTPLLHTIVDLDAKGVESHCQKGVVAGCKNDVDNLLFFEMDCQFVPIFIG